MSPPSFELEAQGNPEFIEGEVESPEGYHPEEVSVAAPQYRKQGFNIYTVLLIASFVCLLFTWILMYVEAGKY
ncbi:MAG: hypothetical protein MK108_04145 [Mariniblastus sp.]|nr:hypothetical protein [Mariniblastus sp.]